MQAARPYDNGLLLYWILGLTPDIILYARPSDLIQTLVRPYGAHSRTLGMLGPMP
jgi:hypothetical protein